MDIYPYGSRVSVSLPTAGGRRRKYYGYVMKVEVTETIRYFVQFHPDHDFKQYGPADLHLEDEDED